uniref:YchF family ATPase n=1 Tax=candidate division WWE3 bacterium TaxID=2053526 RepID=A0A831YYZ9_UNCKA
MSLSVGIVGLPNVGKSTLFNALAARRLAETAPHPFTTIEPHEAVVAVPDPYLAKLSELVKPKETVPATVSFIDIAGLIKGAAQGEGLGNRFLAKIREVDAIVHVVRAFEDPNVPHVHPKIDPKEDLEIVKLELELGGIKDKPVIYAINVSENEISKTPKANLAAPAVVISAKLEEELIDLTPEERKQYLAQLGVTETGLEKLITEAYWLLNLITFYTIKGGKEVHAWSLKQGKTVLDAAGEVHTDFAKNFIKAEAIKVEELLAAGGWKPAKELGKVRLEGRDYLVQNGDVIEFKIGAN